MFDDAMMQSCCIHLFWENILLRNIIEPIFFKNKHVSVPPILIHYIFSIVTFDLWICKGAQYDISTLAVIFFKKKSQVITYYNWIIWGI